MNYEDEEIRKKFEKNFEKTCRHYILKDGLPKAVDLKTWSDWIETHPNRFIKNDGIEGTCVRVVTVFLPLCYLDPQPDGSIKKYFYGTCVRGEGVMHGHEERTLTQEEAEDNHARILQLVKDVIAGKTEIPDCCKKGYC
jgi:hypothetical protein